MPRYIDADIALDKMKNWHTQERLMDCVRDTPTADVAQVIRCKDCLYFEYKVGSYGTCEHWHTNSQDIFDLHFCGYAEPHIKRKR